MRIERDENKIVIPMDPLVWHAQQVIYNTYGVTVSVENKKKDLLKFGRNTAVGTSAATLMTLNGSELNETYVSDNLITHVASGSVADTTQTLTVEGHTISGSNLTFVSQTVALAGRTKTALTTPLARATRAYVSSGTTNLTGPVYFAEDVTFTNGVPTPDSSIHLIIPAGSNQTEKASTSIASTDYWIVTNIYGSIYKKTAGFADILLEYRAVGKVFLQQERFAVNTGVGNGKLDYHPYKIIPANSDVRLIGIADAAASVGGGIQGYLASIVT